MKVEYFPTKIWYISKRNMELFEDRVQPCHWKVFKRGCQHPSHKFEIFWQHIKLFPQCDEHLFFSVPGARNH